MAALAGLLLVSVCAPATAATAATQSSPRPASSSVISPVSTAAALAAATVRTKGGRADAGLAPGVDNWWFDKLKLARVQRRTIGEGVQVAVIDGGLWTDAPDLAGVDLTVHKVAGRDPSTDKMFVGRHGAGVVALLAGRGTRTDGRPGLRGVAPGVEVHYYGSKNLLSSGTYDLPAKQIVAAADDGADIITSSLAWAGDPETLREAIAYAQDAGAVIVKAAGNAGQDRNMSLAGGDTSIVLVNSVDRDAVPRGNTRTFMNRNGPVWNAVSAPGWEATATGIVDGQWVSGVELSGTSIATPIAAGQLALQKSLYPEATSNQLIQSLIHDTTNTDWEWLQGYGFGIASAFEMIKRDPTGWPDVNPLDGTFPRQVLRRFPPDIYGTAADTTPRPGDAPASASTDASEDPADPASDPEPSASAGSDGGEATAPAREVAADEPADTGVPVWLWEIVVAVGAGGILVLAVTRGRRAKPARGKD